MMTNVASRLVGRLTQNAAAGWQVQATRTVFKAKDGSTPISTDISADVPEKNPDKYPQQPMDPRLVAKSEANTSQDSVRFMADKVNQAMGGGADFPKTGGASLREMASEIGDNISESVGGRSADAQSAGAQSAGPQRSNTGVSTPAQEAATRAVEQAKSK